MKKFKALFLNKNDLGEQISEFKLINENDLMNGDVTVEVYYSSLNYKDGLAITGKGPVIRRWPMIPGIDFSGRVVDSKSEKFKIDDKVILTGWGVGEKHFGGYSELARVKSEWLVKIPKNLDEEKSMIIGTAGLTAMLCVMKIQESVDINDGSILVTGASGGVGSFSVHLLSKLGYSVTAVTGKEKEFNYLKDIGAKDVIYREVLGKDLKPLDSEKWAGAIDSVGSKTLSYILSTTKYYGTVVSTGLAQGSDLHTTVFPFIIRGISLIGVESVQTPLATRIKAWSRLSDLIDFEILEKIKVLKKFKDVEELASLIINGKIKGRVLIDLKS